MPDDQWWEERAERHFAESEMRAGMRPMVGPVPHLVNLPVYAKPQPTCYHCHAAPVGRAGDACKACQNPDEARAIMDAVWCRTCGYPRNDQGHPAEDCPPGTTDGRRHV